MTPSAGSARPCPSGAARPGEEDVQLVVQPLLGQLVLGDQAPPVAYRRGQRVLLLVEEGSALALAGQVGQRGAVAVVGLEPSRSQLRSGGGGLRRCEDPDLSGKALVELAHPGLVQPGGGLDGEYGTGAPAYSTTSRCN